MAVSNKKILISGAFQYATVGVQVLVQFCSIVILSRLLTPSDFGTMGIVLILIAFANIVGQLGIGPYFVYNTKSTDQEVNIGFTISLIMGVLLSVFFLLGAPIFANFFNDVRFIKFVQISALSFLFASAASIPENLLERQLKFKSLFWINSGSLVFGYLSVSLTLAYLGFGVWSLIWGNIAQYFFKLLFLFLLSPRFPILDFSFKGVGKIFHFSLGFTMARLFNFSATRGDNFLIGKLLGMSQLGVYSRAYQLMMLFPTYAGTAFEKVLYPVFSHEKENKQRLTDLFVTMNTVILTLTAPVSIIFALFSKEIVFVVLGNQWLEAAMPLAVLSLGIYFRTAYKLGDSLAKALGFVYSRSIREFIYAALIISSVIIFHSYGLVVISVGVLFAIIFNYATSFTLASKILNVSVKKLFIKGKAAIYFIIYLALIGLFRYLTFGSILSPFIILPLVLMITIVSFATIIYSELKTLNIIKIYKSLIDTKQ